MIYLLDTNAVIALLRNKPSSVRDRLRQAKADGASVVTSSIVLYELWYGVARSTRRKDNTEQLRIFLSGTINVISFDDEDTVIAGEIRASLEAIGKPIGPYDVLIAAQALRLGATLVTANTAEFSRVKDLRWQDWGQNLTKQTDMPATS